MTQGIFAIWRPLTVIGGLSLLLAVPKYVAADAPAEAALAFDSYVRSVEACLAQQHQSKQTFLAQPAELPSGNATRLRRGDLIVENLSASGGTELQGALLHHWRGTAFAAGATPADFEQLMKNFNAYPQRFSPQVIRATSVAEQSGHFHASLRVRQMHLITVVMDTAYDVNFQQLDSQHGYSISRSTKIAEIESPGSSAERALSSGEEHGFLWRQNTYWSYEERDGGLYMQIESVSLTRSVPRGLRWIVAPFVESVPRESLEFTLRSVCTAIERK